MCIIQLLEQSISLLLRTGDIRHLKIARSLIGLIVGGTA
jgi:hypothetical protein